MRIKYIVPFPFDEEGVAARRAQVPSSILGPNTVVECMPVRNAAIGDTYYEMVINDMFMAEAGIRAQAEGYDAVIMDTVSDSSLYALRSRLDILVLGPGLVSYAVGAMLGKRFSIVTMWDEWVPLHEKNLDTYHLWDKCASIRSLKIRPDVERLFAGKEEAMFERVRVEAEKAIDEDGADVILLGSTTMHQAGEYVAARIAAPVINPGPLAIKLTESLLQLGLRHSKVAFPGPETIQDEPFFSLMSASGVAQPADEV